MRWWALVIAGSACAPKIDAGPIPVERAAAPARIVAVQADGPDIWLEARVFAGSAADPPGMDGLAALTARTLAAPAGVDVAVDREWVTLAKRCADAACVTAFAQALASPRLDAADADPLRLAGAPDGSLAFEALIFEAHPYGHPPGGRAGTLAILDAQDLRDFHAARYVRESVTVGIAGGDAAVHAALVQGLEALPGRMPPEMLIGRPLDEDGRRTAILDRDADGTTVWVGASWGLSRTDPDYAALYVAFTALDARDDGLRAALEPLAPRRQGHWAVWADPVADADGAAAVRSVIDAVERFARDGITAAELADSAARLGPPPDAASARLTAALDTATTGMPAVHAVVSAAVPALTLEEVNATVTRRLRPEELQILAVTGDAEALRAALGDPGIPVTPLAAVFR